MFNPEPPVLAELGFPHDSSRASLAVPERPRHCRAGSSSSSTIASSNTGTSEFFTNSANSSATNISDFPSEFFGVNIDDIPSKIRNGKIVITLDGGGVRGIFAIVFLHMLAESLSERGYDIRKCVDIMGGTSTGGISTILFAWLHLPLEELIRNYVDFTENLFGKAKASPIGWFFTGVKHSSAHQRKVYTQAIEGKEKKGLASTQLRLDAFNEDANVETARFASGSTHIPMFVVTVDTSNVQKPAVISSYAKNSEDGGTSNMTVVDAAIATSSAPTYFYSLRHKDRNNEDHDFIDGGIGFNNPTEIALRQLRDLYGPEAYGDVVISLGTGHRTANPFKNSTRPRLGLRLAVSSMYGMSRTFVGMATDTESVHHRVEMNYSARKDGATYHRFNPEGLAETMLDDYKAVHSLADKSKEYLEAHKEQLVSHSTARF